MTAIAWKSATGGTWTLGTNWSSGTVPGAADDATIAIAPAAGLSGYTVTIGSDIITHSITLDQAAATLEVDPATLATHLFLQAGTLALSEGTLTGTVTQTGGALWVGPQDFVGSGTLQNVTWQGALHPFFNTGNFGDPSSLLITGPLNLTGAGGSGPGTLILDQSGFTDFQGQQTLDNATVELGATDVFDTPQLTQSNSASAGANLTLGTHLIVDAEGEGTIAVLGQITNYGLIQTEGSATLSITSNPGGGTFTNAGTLLANAGGTIALSSTGFTNQGVVAVAAGGDLLLQGQFGDVWQNPGAIVDQGTITLAGTVTTANLQALHVSYSSGGMLSLSGTLANAGAVLTLGNGATAPGLDIVQGGVVLGGTITETGGTLSAHGGTLSGVTLNGPLLLTGAGESLTIANGLVLTGGSAQITGAGAALNFLGNQALNNAVVQIGASTGASLLASQGSLTLGTGTVVRVHAGAATIAGSPDAASEILNTGTISANAGALLTLGNGAQNQIVEDRFVNTGNISVTGNSVLYLNTPLLTNTGTISLVSSTLLLGNSTAAELAGIKLQSSKTELAGTLTATGATLNVGTGATLGVITAGVAAPGSLFSNAAIIGGTIHDTGSGLHLLGTVSLTGVTYQGVLRDTAPLSDLTLTNVTLQNEAGTQPGTLVVSGAGAELNLATPLTQGTLNIGSVGTAVTLIGQETAGGPALLGAGVTVAVGTAAHAVIGGFDQGNDFATNIVSDATINIDGTLTLDGLTFTNDGLIAEDLPSPMTIAAAEFVNAGTLALTGSLQLDLTHYYQAPPAAGTSFDNTGTILLSGGSIGETGFPAVAIRNEHGASITGTGTINAPLINQGTITATSGELALRNGVNGVGTLQIDFATTLFLEGRISGGQTVQFGGTEGVLSLQGKQFLGSIANFAAGDAIELSAKASAAEFSGNSILVTLENGGSLSLRTTTAETGSLIVGNHGHVIEFAGTDVHATAWAPAWNDTGTPARIVDSYEEHETLWAGMVHHSVV